MKVRTTTDARRLESYEVREFGREPAATFYARMSTNNGTDIDLEAVIREGHKVHTEPEL